MFTGSDGPGSFAGYLPAFWFCLGDSGGGKLRQRKPKKNMITCWFNVLTQN
jgi:hypothetical protein